MEDPMSQNSSDVFALPSHFHRLIRRSCCSRRRGARSLQIFHTIQIQTGVRPLPPWWNSKDDRVSLGLISPWGLSRCKIYLMHPSPLILITSAWLLYVHQLRCVNFRRAPNSSGRPNDVRAALHIDEMLFWHGRSTIPLSYITHQSCERGCIASYFFRQGLRRPGRGNDEDCNHEGTKDFHTLPNFYVVLSVGS